MVICHDGESPSIRSQGGRGQGNHSTKGANSTITTPRTQNWKRVFALYPQGIPTGLTQHFFCIRYAMGGRPNFALRHRLALAVDDAYVIADRDLYVSSGYNDTQAVAGLLPVDNGTVAVYLARTTTDQLGGFGASAKQAIGRGMLAKQISEIFEKARAGLKDK